jgi:hypothetical protein
MRRARRWPGSRRWANNDPRRCRPVCIPTRVWLTKIWSPEPATRTSPRLRPHALCRTRPQRLAPAGRQAELRSVSTASLRPVGACLARRRQRAFRRHHIVPVSQQGDHHADRDPLSTIRVWSTAQPGCRRLAQLNQPSGRTGARTLRVGRSPDCDWRRLGVRSSFSVLFGESAHNYARLSWQHWRASWRRQRLPRMRRVENSVRRVLGSYGNSPASAPRDRRRLGVRPRCLG